MANISDTLAPPKSIITGYTTLSVSMLFEPFYDRCKIDANPVLENYPFTDMHIRLESLLFQRSP